MPRKQRKESSKPPFSMSGLWSITTSSDQKLRQKIASVNWNEPTDDTRYDQRETKIEGGVAVIPVIGIITKYASFYDRFCDLVSSEWLIAQIEQAESNPMVRRIVMLIDSCGGMVDGTTLVGGAIKRCRKRVDAVVSDNCCSGGYWIACQCKTITANAVSDIGSIGVVMVGCDDSEFWNDMGVKFHVVSSGGIKGAGMDHKITDELKAEWQRNVDDTHEEFISTVSNGRGLTIEESRRLADGRTYRAVEAMSLKLIDRVADAGVAIDNFIMEVTTMTQQEFQQMATAHPEWTEQFATAGYEKAKAEITPKHATAAELKQAFGKDAEFFMARVDQSASMAEHKAAYADYLAGKLATANATIDGLKAELAKSDPATAGVKQPINTPISSAGGVSALAQAVEAANKRVA